MSVKGEGWGRFVPSAGSIVGVAFMLVGWQLVSTQFVPTDFPGLLFLAESFWQVITNQTQYDAWTHLSASLARITIGFAIVMTIGTLIGVYMGINEVAEDFLSAPITAALTVPSVIWAFLGVLWFGLTELLVPVFVIVMIILPYVTVNMWQGAKSLDPEIVEMGRAFKANRKQMWLDVYIPHLTPFTFATARFAFAISWKISLIAEIFGAKSGVGIIASNYYQLFNTAMIIAWALPIMFLTLFIERILQRLEKRAYKWRPSGEEELDLQVIE